MLAPTARTCGNVVSMTATPSTATTATVIRRSITTWVRTRLAWRLSGTSVRNRASAMSSNTITSAATSQATAPITASQMTCRSTGCQSPFAGPARTASCTATSALTSWTGR
jgi:hypothetical protein